MSITSTAGGFLVTCPACGWERYTTTRRVAEVAEREHEGKCRG